MKCYSDRVKEDRHLLVGPGPTAVRSYGGGRSAVQHLTVLAQHVLAQRRAKRQAEELPQPPIGCRQVDRSREASQGLQLLIGQEGHQRRQRRGSDCQAEGVAERHLVSPRPIRISRRPHLTPAAESSEGWPHHWGAHQPPRRRTGPSRAMI
eukprot:954969-Prorocentrum_minimum.AAC.1